MDENINPNEWNSREHSENFATVFTNRVFPFFLELYLLLQVMVVIMLLTEKFHILTKLRIKLEILFSYYIFTISWIKYETMRLNLTKRKKTIGVFGLICLVFIFGTRVGIVLNSRQKYGIQNVQFGTFNP